MCGIVAYIGKQPAFPVILKGLKRLEYRGYDSSGIALFGEKELLIGASIFHVLIGLAVLRVPGVKDMKMPKKDNPADYSHGEQK